MEDVKLNLVETFDDLQDMRLWAAQRRTWLGLDLETTGVNCGLDRIRTLQLGDAQEAWTVPVEGIGGWGGPALELLAEYDGRIVCHNAIFEESFMRAAGHPLPEDQVDDTMVMSHLDGSGMSMALKSVARRLVDKKAAGAQQVLDIAMKEQRWDWADVPMDFPPYWAYGALDPVLTVRVAEILWPKVAPMREIYDAEMGAIGVLSRAMVTGMKLNVEYAEQQSEAIRIYLEQLRPQLPCNPLSEKALVPWLQSRGAQLTVKTEKGNWSTDDDVLKSLEEQIPECKLIREYRKHQKMKTSYFDNALKLQLDGVVHPSIHVLGARRTGRMSVTDPALQTVPKSRQGRYAYMAREGQTLIAADFNGMEMRMLAHMANETHMLEEFRAGTDMHTWVAAMVYSTSMENVTSQQRSIAKSAAFAKIYGAGIEKFALTAGTTIEGATEFLERYDGLFPAVREFQEMNSAEVHRSAAERNSRTWGIVRTWTGRPLMVEKDKAYASTNYMIQGGCAELTKHKICELDAAGLGDAIRMPIHDEIIFELADDEVEDAEVLIHEVMGERERFAVEFPVEAEHAKIWGDMYS